MDRGTTVVCPHCAGCMAPLVDKESTYRPTARQRKTLAFWEKVKSVIYGCGTDSINVRGVPYLMETLRLIEKTDNDFKRVERAIADMRRAGVLPYEKIAESHRERVAYPCWADLGAFVSTVKISYQRDPWQTQPRHIEVWLEKDGLARIVEPVCVRYRFYPVVTKGRPSLTLLHDSAPDLRTVGKPITLYYLGDLDPGGVDSTYQIEHDLCTTYGVPDLEVVRLAITRCQLDQPDLGLREHTRACKAKDGLARAFDRLYGRNTCVELDALPPAVLQRIVGDAIRSSIDPLPWNAEIEREQEEQASLDAFVSQWQETRS